MTALDTARCLDLFALIWFLGRWGGYARGAERRSATEVGLASVMHRYRREIHSSILSSLMPNLQ